MRKIAALFFCNWSEIEVQLFIQTEETKFCCYRPWGILVTGCDKNCNSDIS